MVSEHRQRRFLLPFVGLVLGITGAATAVSEERQNSTVPAVSPATTGPRLNMVGAYGPWLANQVLGDGPARLSFRTGKWATFDEWRRAGRT